MRGLQSTEEPNEYHSYIYYIGIRYLTDCFEIFGHYFFAYSYTQQFRD